MTPLQITFTDLSVDEVNLLFQGLGQLPLAAGIDLWMKLKQQGDAQVAAHKAAVEANKPKAKKPEAKP